MECYFDEDMNIKFYDIQHEEQFVDVINRMNCIDCYHLAVAYLITLDTVCRQHINQLYNFNEQCIMAEGLNESWQTSTSRKTTKLAFNLWNGYCNVSVDEIFSCSYAPYYFESIKLRFPESFR